MLPTHQPHPNTHVAEHPDPDMDIECKIAVLAATIHRRINGAQCWSRGEVPLDSALASAWLCDVGAEPESLIE
jgi:hypothetical protein